MNQKNQGAEKKNLDIVQHQNTCKWVQLYKKQEMQHVVSSCSLHIPPERIIRSLTSLSGENIYLVISTSCEVIKCCTRLWVARRNSFLFMGSKTVRIRPSQGILKWLISFSYRWWIWRRLFSYLQIPLIKDLRLTWQKTWNWLTGRTYQGAQTIIWGATVGIIIISAPTRFPLS